MSSLLERMVQRARAPLPSVEPLLPARYAPQRTADQQSWIASENLTDFSAGENQISVPEPAARSHFEPSLPIHAAEIRALTEVKISASEERLPRRGFLPARQSSLEQTLPSSQVESSRRTPENPTRSVFCLPKTDFSTLLPQFETATSSEPALALNSRSTLPAPDSANLPLSHAKKSAREIAAVETPAQRSAVALPRHQDPPSLHRHDQPAAHFEQSRETRISDVTISIGHIEIRAEQAAPRAKAPAFRPRVSLNDFLNQRNRERV